MTHANQATSATADIRNNFISHFNSCCQRTPQRVAISAMDGRKEILLSYQQLAAEAAFWQSFWRGQGFVSGDRVVMALQPGVHAYAITISLLAAGLVPVFIDVGMPRHHIRYVLEGSSPVAVVGLRRALRWHWLVPELKQCRRFSVDGPFPGVTALPLRQALAAREDDSAELVLQPCSSDAHGIISFTSEIRGIPMGADRTHSSLQRLHQAMLDYWPHNDGEVDCTCFPVTVLHNLSCGMTTVLPDINFATPGQLTKKQAGRVLRQFERNQVTRVSAAPAFFAALCDYMEEHNIRIPEIDGLVLSRATVSMRLARRLHIRFPQAWSRIVYGATEAEPIAAVTLDEYLKYDSSAGYLVGPPVADSEVVICRDLPAGRLSEADVNAHICGSGEAGEILVAGPHVLGHYVNSPHADPGNKVSRNHEQAPLWYRTGDTGFMDDAGRLWLTGRVKDLVVSSKQVIQPYVFEKQIDKQHGVQRCALIANDDSPLRLYLVCDPPLDDLLPSLETVLRTLKVRYVDIYRLTVMPTDRRHNSKIDRPLLRTRSQRIHATEYQRWKAPNVRDRSL